MASYARCTDVLARPRRERIVKRAIAWLRRLSTQLYLEIVVVGIRGKNILPLDVDYAGQIKSHWHILWRLFADAQHNLDDYDYLLVLEDDVLVPRRTIARMLAANHEFANKRHAIFPNHTEFFCGLLVNPDLVAMPGWTGQTINWRSKTWYQATNPHSAILFLGRHQSEGFRKVDFSWPRITLGEYTTSAFERAHSGYMLFREKSRIPSHFVVHRDSWIRHNPD